MTIVLNAVAIGGAFAAVMLVFILLLRSGRGRAASFGRSGDSAGSGWWGGGEGTCSGDSGCSGDGGGGD